MPVGLPDEGTTVRVQDGRTVLSDGPFAETKEALGGCFLVEADDLDAALAIAATVPATRFGRRARALTVDGSERRFLARRLVEPAGPVALPQNRVGVLESIPRRAS